jgi:hypothetical protein
MVQKERNTMLMGLKFWAQNVTELPRLDVAASMIITQSHRQYYCDVHSPSISNYSKTIRS